MHLILFLSFFLSIESLTYKRLDDIIEINTKLWKKSNLTWTIITYPKNLEGSKKYLVYYEFYHAFKSWERISHFKFEYLENNYMADIDIYFIPSKHNLNDKDRFFTPGVLAHAFFPEDGDIHLNNEVNWTISFLNVSQELSIFEVALHEIGHSLGLNHAIDINSIMYPVYIERNITALNFEFNLIDKQLIRQLYQKSYELTTQSIMTTEVNRHPRGDEYPNFGCERVESIDWCNNDLIFNLIFEIEGYLFLYKGNYFWIYNDVIMPKRFEHLTYWDESLDELVSIIKIKNDIMLFYKRYAIIKDENCNRKTVSYRDFNVEVNIDGVYYNMSTEVLYMFSKETPITYFKISNFNTNDVRMSIKPIQLWQLDIYDYDIVFGMSNKTFFMKGNKLDYFDFNLRVLIRGIDFKDLFLIEQCNLYPYIHN